MSSGFANNMSSSTGGLSKLWCDKCLSETLHLRGTCGCGAVHVTYPVNANITRLLREHIQLPGSRPMRKRWNGSVKP